jgi:endonuclease YncB( thermonuclease family)
MGLPRDFRGVVWRVVDGDTVDVLLDLDVFDQWLMRRFRLLGCNARESRMPGGREAKANLELLLPHGEPVTVTSVQVDKYGRRYDALITLPDGRDLVDELIAGQWAAAWDGKGVPPVPPWPREVP